MRQYLFSLFLLPFTLQGQNTEPDSVSTRELDGITVTAAAQRTEPTKTVYIPDSRQKAAAADGMSLLARMNIPQLSINPVAGTVKTADEQGVSLFINYNPASDEDIAGLNPAVVRKVEYLDFPSDPRFLRAPHAVNFITYEYTYGGYTKLSGKERFMINSGEAAVYSKFAYREMEYDVMLSGSYNHNNHTGTAEEEVYRFPTGTLKRESLTTAGKYHEHELFAGLRASWHKGEDLSFRNLLSYSKENIPVNNTCGDVTFSELYPSESYTAAATSDGNEVAWNSELYASLGKRWTFTGNFQAELLNNRTTDLYTTSLSDITNHADENTWNLRGNVQFNKAVTDRISLFTNFISFAGHTDIDYTGSSNATNLFRQTFTGIYLGFSLNIQKIAGSVDGGYAFESNTINTQKTDDRYPFTHINIQYAPNRKNSLSLWFQYATLSPDAAMKNPNIIRQSELMYISGNASLNNSRHISANISYVWLPDNRWQMAAYTTFFKIINRQIAVYSPDGPDGLMLKKYQNDGNYNHGQAGIRLTCKLLNNSLTLSASPRLLLYRITGSNSASHYPFTGSLNADYYLGNFFFNAYWESRSSYVDGETSYLRKMPSSYSLSAGWSACGWNVQLAVINPFRSSWTASKDVLKSDWYDSSLTRFGSYSHRRLSLSVTYTFNYGRRVNSTGELTGDSSISTSILR